MYTLFSVDVHFSLWFLLMFTCTLFHGCGNLHFVFFVYVHLHFVHCWCLFALCLWLWSFEFILWLWKVVVIYSWCSCALCFMVMDICTFVVDVHLHFLYGCGTLNIVYCWCLFALCFLLMFICTLFHGCGNLHFVFVDVHSHFVSWLWKFSLCFLF